MLISIDNQLGRRNLTDLDRVALLECKYPILQKIAKENQRKAALANQPQAANQDAVNLPHPETKGRVREQLAKEAGVSGKTYDNLRTVNRDGTEELKQAVRDKRIDERTGPMSEENELVRAHEGLCRSVVSKYAYCTALPREDLLQEARKGLLQAIRRFDSSKGGFGVFAYVTVRGFILNAIRNEAAQWPGHILQSMDEPICESGEEIGTLHDRLTKQPPIDIERQLRLRRALWRLPLDDRHRMTAMAHGTPQRTDNLTVSRERCRQLRAVALGRLQRIFKRISALESISTSTIKELA